MDEKIYEKFINNSPEALSIEAIEKILDQMRNCVCKIFNGNKQGTGFFLKIPYNNSSLPVLVTNNHIIEEKDFKNKKIITIYISNEEKGKNIKIDKERIFYTNVELDTTIIGIKENEDGIKKFLELDEKINECLTMNKEEIFDFLQNIYSNKSIYVLNYPEGKDVVASIAQPPKFVDKKIRHKCQTKEGSSGSPIMLSHNQKVIGVHFGCFANLKYNLGSIIIYSIIDLNQRDNNKNSYNQILEEKENENIENLEVKVNDYLKNIKLINLFGNSFIKNNTFYNEITEVEINNYSKNEFNIEEIKEVSTKLYKMLNDKNTNIKKYFKIKEQQLYLEKFLRNNRDYGILKITTNNGISEIGVICEIKKPFSSDLLSSPLLIINSKLFGKNIKLSKEIEVLEKNL